MKKFLAAILLCFAVLFANAQSQHLMFMGISMDNTKTDFVSQLKAIGFTITMEKALTTWMEGTFAGESVVLEVLETSKTHKVAVALVKFKESGYPFYFLTLQLENKYGNDVMSFDYQFIKDEKKHVAWIVDKDAQGIGNIIAACEDTDGLICVLYIDIKNQRMGANEIQEDF